MPDLLPLYPVARHHLEAMSDEVGIMQHAKGREPDPAHGYCTDDVARALQVDLLHQAELGWPAVAIRAWGNLRFLADALDGPTGRFRNFRQVGGAWLDGIGSEDCQGRAVHALGDAIASAPEAGFVQTALSVFERALPAALTVRALRATASVSLGCVAATRGWSGDAAGFALRSSAQRLSAAFATGPSPDWPWPEPRLTYENGLPARALITAGRQLGRPDMVEVGLRSLDWLVSIQTAPEGHLSPLGNGWWTRGGPRSRFDQQPIEATALLLAAEAALLATGDQRYRAVMERAYGWFLGQNDLSLAIAEPGRGAGCDGLTPAGVNTNQGAESTLMWLVTLERIRAMRQGDARSRAVAVGPPSAQASAPTPVPAAAR